MTSWCWANSGEHRSLRCFSPARPLGKSGRSQKRLSLGDCPIVCAGISTLCAWQQASWWPPRGSCGQQHDMCASQHDMWCPPRSMCVQQQGLCDQQQASCAPQQGMWWPPRSLCGQQHGLLRRWKRRKTTRRFWGGPCCHVVCLPSRGDTSRGDRRRSSIFCIVRGFAQNLCPHSPIKTTCLCP